MRVLVTGGTGAIGPAIVRALAAAGHAVRVLAAGAAAPGVLPEAVEVRIGDVGDRDAVRSATAGMDAVLHLAALLHIVAPDERRQGDYERVNVGGTASVRDAALEAGVGRVVLFSTIAVYGSHPGLITEDTLPRPETLYGKTKLAAERLLLETCRTDGAPLATVLRLGAAYGARVKGNYRRLVTALAAGRFVPVGSGRNRRTLIFDRDAAAAALLALDHPAAAGRIYNVSDGEVHPVNAIIAAICEALGRPAPRLALPLGPLSAAAWVADHVSRATGVRFPVSRAALAKYTENMAVEGRRIQAELGFRPAFDLRYGWRCTVEEMKRAGDL
jgi:nucleoside-diphosphate-sugar epimerase